MKGKNGMGKTKKKKTTTRLLGKHSKLGIIATWIKTFEANAKKHLTDPQILDRMKKEFPGYDKKSKIFSNVKAHRRFYNKGILTKGKKPKTKSIAYPAAGEKKK